MTSVYYLTAATNENYSSEALDYIKRFDSDILDVSNILGISAGALAGAMAEERQAYGNLDEFLDIYAKSGIDPTLAIHTLPTALRAGPVGLAVWAALNASGLATTRTHAEWAALYEAAKSFSGRPGSVDKIMNPALIDVGLANFKIATAIDIVVNFAGKYPALDLTPYLGNYSLLVDHLIDKSNSLTAKLYGLYIKEYAEPFFKKHSAYADEWESLPQTFRDALMVTYTNLGEEAMTNLIRTPYEPQPAFTTGGGMNHLLNAAAIGSALGLPGYGSDAVGVSDLVALAKTEDDAGLAARYALLQLRHVVLISI